MTRPAGLRLVVGLVLSIGRPAPAMAESALRLEQVLRSTRAQHPKVFEALQQASAADGDVLAGLGYFDPTLTAKGEGLPHGDYQNGKGEVALKQRTGLWGLSLVGGWRLGRGDFPIYKKDQSTSSGGEATLGMSLPLLRGGPIDTGRAKLWASRHKRVVAQLGVDQVQLELSRRAAHSYWSWVAAGRRLSIAEDLVRIARTRMKQIVGRVRRGDLPPLEETDNQRAILKREGAAVRARRAFENAAFELSLYYRDARGQPRVAQVGQLPRAVSRTPSVPKGKMLVADIRYALTHRPEIKALRAKRRVVEVDQRLASNARLPTLDLSARGGYDVGSEPFESRRTEVLLGLTFRFPLLIRAARGALRRARGALGAIDAKSRLLADRVLMQVRDAYSALKAAKESLEIARRELTVAHRVEEAERERFRLGASTLLSVNLREQAAAEAKVRAVDSAAGLKRAMADYLAVTARGLVAAQRPL